MGIVTVSYTHLDVYKRQSFRYHTDKENLLQIIYIIIACYFEEDASDELTNDPVFKAVLKDVYKRQIL